MHSMDARSPLIHQVKLATQTDARLLAARGGPCAFLVVQWFRIHLPMQRIQAWSLVWRDSTCHGAIKHMHHNYWACAPRTHALQQEKPQQWKVCTQQLEKGLAQQPVQPNMYVNRNRKSFKVQDAKFTYLFYLRNKLRSIVRHQTPGTGQQSCGESGVLEHCWWECK